MPDWDDPYDPFAGQNFAGDQLAQGDIGGSPVGPILGGRGATGNLLDHLAGAHALGGAGSVVLGSDRGPLSGESSLPTTEDWNHGVVDPTRALSELDARAAGDFGPKTTILFDNDQSWGNGANINTVDRLRYQQRAVWPAYFNESAVPNKPPSFLTPNQDLGQGPIKPTSRDLRAHYFKWAPFQFAAAPSPISEFGFGAQLFDLMINASEFAEHFESAYGVSYEEIQGFEGSDANISQHEKFRTAVAALYGLGVGGLGEPGFGQDPLADPLAPLREFVDHATEVPLLLSKSEIAAFGLIETVPFGLVKPVYNYMLLDYEQVLESVVKPAGQTRVIPSIYALQSEIYNTLFEAVVPPLDDAEDVGPNPPWFPVHLEEDFKNFVTVGGLIPGIRPPSTRRPGWGTSYSQKNYFCRWTAAVDRLAPLDPQQENPSTTAAENRFLLAGKNFKSIIIPPDQLDFINVANNEKETYPMFNEIQFKTDGRKDFANLFIQNHFSSLMMRESMYAQPVPYNTYTRSFSGANQYNPASVGIPGWFSTNTVLNPVELETTDISGFWEDIDADGKLLAEEQELLDDPSVIMVGSPGVNRGQFNDVLLDGSSDEDKLQQRRLFKETFREKLTEICGSSIRSYQQLMGYPERRMNERAGEHEVNADGEPVHGALAGMLSIPALARSETVFYKIEKRLNNRVIQEFYVPNNFPIDPKDPLANLDIFKYIDTQVLYGKLSGDSVNAYDYRIYAGQLVIGSRYGRYALSAPTPPPPAAAGAADQAGADSLQPLPRRRLEALYEADRALNAPLNYPDDRNTIATLQAEVDATTLRACRAFGGCADNLNNPPDGFDVEAFKTVLWQQHLDSYLRRFPRNAPFGSSDGPGGVWNRYPSAFGLLEEVTIISAALLAGNALEAMRARISVLNNALFFARTRWRLPDAFEGGVGAHDRPFPSFAPLPGAVEAAFPWPVARGDYYDIQVHGGDGSDRIRRALRLVRDIFSTTAQQIQALRPSEQPIPGMPGVPLAPVDESPEAPALDSLFPPMHAEVGMFDILGSPDPNGTLQVKIKCMSYVIPSLKLIQVPIFHVPEVAIFSKPPASPDIDITPYRAIDDRALIGMNEQASTHRAETPVFIESEDLQTHLYVTRGQYFNDWIDVDPSQREVLDIPIVFGNDELASSYEVYRIETPPESYTDFAGNLHHIASLTDQNGKPLASSASLIDALIPNRKYYYTFRIRDAHGQLSNPTDVYQVELVNDGSAVFMLFETYEFPETPLNLTKNVRRYLKLGPALAQSLVNMPRSGLLDESGEPSATAKNKTIHLGIPSPSTWGRKYKFRLMSKKTGRKIDINIDFKVNQIAEPDINQDSGCDPGFEAPLPQEPLAPAPPAGGQAYAGEIRDNAGDSLYNQPVQQYGQIEDLTPGGTAYDDIHLGPSPVDPGAAPQERDMTFDDSVGGNFGEGI